MVTVIWITVGNEKGSESEAFGLEEALHIRNRRSHPVGREALQERLAVALAADAGVEED